MDDMYNILPDDITNFKELEEWYDKFKAMPYRTQLQSNDISLSKYGKTNIERYNNMRADMLLNIDSHTVDPDFISDEDNMNIEDVSEEYIEKVLELSNIANILDTDIGLNEAVSSDKFSLIYVVLFSNQSIVSKVIKMWTKSEYSHSAIGFDKKLENIYSYAQDRNDVNSKRIGFTIDNITKYTEPGRIKVYAIAIPTKYVYRIKKTLNDYIQHMYTTTYNKLAILSIVINKALKKANLDKFSMICSQFVYTILSLANIHTGINKQGIMVTPNDIDQALSVKNNVVAVKDYDIHSYDSKDFYREVKKGLQSKNIILDESCEL